MQSGGKMLNREEIEKKVVEYFSKYTEVSAVYIFGSFNMDRFNDNSDLDLALIYFEAADKFEKFNLKLEFMAGLEKLLGRNIDIVDFVSADLKLKHKILDGKLIYCTDQSRRVKLEKKAILNYIDMKRFYDIYEKKLGKGF
ncbi:MULTISPECIES: nucleotidyltransferase domain-containing protein [unclassified Halanaerobium]|uniref:type VII toxin-antitoxin system MntA family adenylyltransferase antitoxin n=1 Tax=unclassified Halanaerobium TaxID=2641197 RepID=UPI000DF37D7B|nr:MULTISPECIES: nucleotidyltransferase domain-containing protein [unclassified Halanaerobium]RCW41361.1 putative nucleotidyltransferase [Halanaerobium sp. MA284_MarDTE_T2]RCW86942.1 putative nucleotidyltransferase [Halanaerobium sp. DL-01]